MPFPVFTNGTVLPASDLNAIGLWKVASTTFSASSYVAVESCFNANYNNYLITMAIRGSSATFARWRLRAGSTDSSGANYFRFGYTTSFSAGGLTAYNAGSETSWIPACEYGTTANGFGFSQINLNGPFNTSFTGGNIIVNNSDAGSIYNLGLTHNLATSYNGFSVFPNTGTMTGTITVYGVKA